MVKVATRADILKKRLYRLLDAHHNPGRKQVMEIINPLANIAPVYLFGGAIRDIALEGLYRFYSDLDFVVDCPPEQLADYIKRLPTTLPVQQNKFGGYRIHCDKWWLDIWALENTWAFKQGCVKFDSPSSLLKTTILNWDAILYNVKNKQLIMPAHYLAELQSGLLDLQLAENPNPTGALIRILRCLSQKPVHYISPKLCHYLQSQLTITPFEYLKSYEQKHQGTAYLSQIPNVIMNHLTTLTITDTVVVNPLQRPNLELL
ncbi:hypothetical protein [Gayadomonas joobiniege]|uniref:hypothetical protein n=1 Tax=Gayadomonas joobiniege TaxID=1234606 RepID=UPI00037A4B9B|nr:hypothetical protein [Gayadomonas joobiniege]